MLTEAILLEQNKRLRQERDELLETVRQMRLEALPDVPLPIGVPHLTPLEETILRLLISSDRLRTHDFLYDTVYDGEAERDPQIIKVIISRLRKKCAGVVDIETIWGRGYMARLVVAGEARAA